MFGYSSWGCLFLILGLVQPAPHPAHPSVPFLTPSLTQLFLVLAPIGSFPSQKPPQVLSPRACLISLPSWALSLVTPGSGSRASYTLHTSWQVRSPPPTPTLFGIHLCMGLTGSPWKIKNPPRNHSVSGTKTAAKMPPGLQLPRLPPSKEPVGPEEKGDPQEPGNKQAPPGGDTLRRGERRVQPAGPGPRVARMKNTHIFF